MSATPVVAAILAVATAGVCAAADGALFALDPHPGTSAPAGVPGIVDRERAHRALAFARVIAHLAAGAFIALAFELDLANRRHAIPVAATVALVVVALVEGAARAIGGVLGARLLVPLQPAVHLVERLLAPVIAVGTAADNVLARALPPPLLAEEGREANAEQFRQVVAAEADVSRDEEAILHGVFTLADTPVRDVMVPRVDILGIERDTRWSEVVDRVRSTGHARLPVYEETLDGVIGILYAKDLLSAVVAGDPPPGGWQTLVRPAEFIPTTKTIERQLRDFQASGQHIAIVIDEFGGTAGLVTIEDILEEIVGEIRDEHDEERPDVEMEDGTRFWVAGRVTLDELCELLGRDFSRPGIATVGGLVYTTFGRVPGAGERIEIDGVKVVIERVRRRRIERVYFELPDAPADRGEEDDA